MQGKTAGLATFWQSLVREAGLMVGSKTGLKADVENLGKVLASEVRLVWKCVETCRDEKSNAVD